MDWAHQPASPINPTGSIPITATSSPNWISAISTPRNPVGTMSLTIVAAPRSIPSGRRAKLPSASFTWKSSPNTPSLRYIMCGNAEFFSSPHHESTRRSTRAIGSIHAFVFKPINADEQGSPFGKSFPKTQSQRQHDQLELRQNSPRRNGSFSH